MKKLLILLTFCFLPFTLSNAQQYGWVKIVDVFIDKVEFIDTLHGWGSGNDFYYTRDGGYTWNTATGGEISAHQISMYDTLIGWAAGISSFPSGGIQKTTNGGMTWETEIFHSNVGYEGTHTFSPLKNISSGTKHDSGDTGKVAKTANGGTTWAEKTFADSIGIMGKMQFLDSLHGWLVAQGNPSGAYILKTSNGGITYKVIPTAHVFTAISFIDVLHGWGISTFGTVHKTTDGGETWNQQFCICDTLEDLTPSALSFVDSLNGWAFGFIFFEGDLSGAIYRTTDGGYSWYREFVTHESRELLDGQMFDKFHGWAVGDAGVVYSYKPRTNVVERLPDIPKTFSLRQNYPNPFNPATNIEYELKEFSNVHLSVYDINGKEIQQLINTTQPAGVYRIRFNASALASGTYFYTITTKSFSDTKSMSLIK